MRNFIEQFKYQFKNYFDTDSEIAAGDQWNYIKLNLLLTILPVINFCLLFLLFGMISMVPNAAAVLKALKTYHISDILFCAGVFIPPFIILLLSGSYISYIIRCIKSKKFVSPILLFLLILLNFSFYGWLLIVSIKSLV